MINILYPSQIEYLENNRRKEDSLILEMEVYAKENKIPIINWNAAELLEQLIKIKSPRRVLEIGTAIGYSTIRIANNLTEDSLVDTIELSAPSIAKAKSYFNKSRMISKIKQLEGNALNILPTLNAVYDFIFLDADKKDYVKLFELSLNVLKQNGVIFVDNLLWQGYTASKLVPQKNRSSTKQIRVFNQHFLNTTSLNATILPVGDGVGLGIKK